MTSRDTPQRTTREMPSRADAEAMLAKLEQFALPDMRLVWVRGYLALLDELEEACAVIAFYADYNNLFHQDYGLKARAYLRATDATREEQP